MNSFLYTALTLSFIVAHVNAQNAATSSSASASQTAVIAGLQKLVSGMDGILKGAGFRVNLSDHLNPVLSRFSSKIETH